MHEEEYYEMISFYPKTTTSLLYDLSASQERSVSAGHTVPHVNLDCARQRVSALRALTEASVAIHRSLVHASSFLSLNVRGTRYSRVSYRG